MVWSQVPWSGGPWSGPVIPAAPPGQVLPPNVPPGGTTSYTYGIQQGAYPWAYGGWSGAVTPVAAYVGGVIAVPNPSVGTVSVSVWWPYASALQVLRVGPDGVQTPVRGAYPATVGATMTNYATNPNSIATTGYVPGTGSPTLSLITRTDSAGGSAVRATNASAGTSEVTVPQSCTGAPMVTVSFDLQLSAKATSVTVTLAWNNAVGGALTATAVALTADQISASTGQFFRQLIQVVPPGNAAVCSTLKVNAGGMPAGGTLDLDRWRIVQAADTGSYADGDTLGGQWTGTVGLSTSVIAPVSTVVDGECPLDVACYYTVFSTMVQGGFATSPSITLPSNDVSWLSHPATPWSPVQVRPTKVPTLSRKIDQGVFPIIGSAYPVVVSGSVRTAPAGTLELLAATQTDRDTLLGMFADGSALLLRTPADYGYGQGMWIAVGDLDENPTGPYTWQPGRLLTFPFQQVASPSGPNTLVA